MLVLLQLTLVSNSGPAVYLQLSRLSPPFDLEPTCKAAKLTACILEPHHHHLPPGQNPMLRNKPVAGVPLLK